MRRTEPSGDTRELARLIRSSRLLGSELRQHWLRVLPHLTPSDRARLRDILRAAPKQ